MIAHFSAFPAAPSVAIAVFVVVLAAVVVAKGFAVAEAVADDRENVSFPTSPAGDSAAVAVFVVVLAFVVVAAAATVVAVAKPVAPEIV